MNFFIIKILKLKQILIHGMTVMVQLKFLVQVGKILMEKHTLDLAGTGIGIQNVVTRLRMYYGEDLSVVLESEPEKGTKFTFWLPIPENPEKDIE